MRYIFLKLDFLEVYDTIVHNFLKLKSVSPKMSGQTEWTQCVMRQLRESLKGFTLGINTSSASYTEVFNIARTFYKTKISLYFP